MLSEEQGIKKKNYQWASLFQTKRGKTEENGEKKEEGEEKEGKGEEKEKGEENGKKLAKKGRNSHFLPHSDHFHVVTAVLSVERGKLAR